MTITSAVTDPSSCGANDGIIDHTVTGGYTPYVYQWGNGSNAEDSFNLSAGSYFTSATDTNGCVVSYSTTLIEECAPACDLSIGGTANIGESILNEGTAYLYDISDSTTVIQSVPITNGLIDFQDICPGDYVIAVQPTGFESNDYGLTYFYGSESFYGANNFNLDSANIVGVAVELLGMEDHRISDNTTKLYPNPSSGVVHIRSTENIQEVHVYNILGDRVLTSNKTSFNLSNNPSGGVLHCYSHPIRNINKQGSIGKITTPNS
ncbi:MAG: hypothetical protein HRT72_13450 [Flavobacteriales bacterium]|nr:hypothetical protein [Flavobacteriales bacterium]